MATDLEAVNSWLDGASFKIKRELAGKIKKEADGLRDAIFAAARKKTGKLASTVKVRRRRNELELEVVAGGDETLVEVRKGSGQYFDRVLFEEYGTQKMPAAPFFYNTARERMPEIRQNIEAAVEDAVSKL